VLAGRVRMERGRAVRGEGSPTLRG
jgi:hypothetical protein